MGSVIDECVCPKCGYEHAISDYYYKIGIEYIFCRRCGYNNEWEGIDTGDEDSEAVCKEYGGFGCLTVSIDGFGSLFGLDFEGSAKEIMKTFKQSDYKNKKGEVCNRATVTFKEDGKWKLMNLLTREIQDFEEVEE